MLLRACSSGGLKLLRPESLVLAWGASGLGASGHGGARSELQVNTQSPLAACCPIFRQHYGASCFLQR